MQTEQWIQCISSLDGAPALGADLVEVKRMAENLSGAWAETFVTRILTRAEQEEFASRFAPESKRRAEWLAGRFAAKEAGLKALGSGLAKGRSWQDLEVRVDAAGKPSLHVVSGDQAGLVLPLTITHEAGLAVAICVSPNAVTAPATAQRQPYPYFDGNVGGHFTSLDRDEAVAFLCPTGIRAMAKRGRRIVYEVVRLEAGQPIFWEAHLDRMEASAAAEGLPFPGREAWFDLARRLYLTEPRERANLRLVLGADGAWAHYSQFYYPSVEQQTAGVVTNLLDWERVEPQVKCIRPDYKAAVAKCFAKTGPAGAPFEVLLRDHVGRVTEGSRSNFFWLGGNTVYSAPADRILLGITRRALLQAIDRLGLHYSEDLPTLEAAQAAGYTPFITGSPIDILPVSEISGVAQAPASTSRLPELMAAYQAILREEGAGWSLQEGVQHE